MQILRNFTKVGIENDRRVVLAKIPTGIKIFIAFAEFSTFIILSPNSPCSTKDIWNEDLFHIYRKKMNKTKCMISKNTTPRGKKLI